MATSPFYPFLRRVRIENYRSIAHCDVELQPLTFLVGPNGSGKSNFLDAIRFVADGMRGSLDDTIAVRGSFQELLRYQAENEWFSVELVVLLSDGVTAKYSVSIGRNLQGGPWVSLETCDVATGEQKSAHYVVADGRVLETSMTAPPPTSAERLYLPLVAGLPEFRPVFDALNGMSFYHIVPQRMRGLNQFSALSRLMADGGNVASVLLSMERMLPAVKSRIEQYLGAILPSADQVGWQKIEDRLLLHLMMSDPDSGALRRMTAGQLSDGTLRALGVLVAMSQQPAAGQKVSLIGLEEPETAIHPGAVGVLLDAMIEASLTKQVLVTTHSPDLLDSTEVTHDSILAVAMEDSQTTIRPIDEEGRRIMRDRLITPGEFLRAGQLDSVEYKDAHR